MTSDGFVRRTPAVMFLGLGVLSAGWQLANLYFVPPGSAANCDVQNCFIQTLFSWVPTTAFPLIIGMALSDKGARLREVVIGALCTAGASGVTITLIAWTGFSANDSDKASIIIGLIFLYGIIGIPVGILMCWAGMRVRSWLRRLVDREANETTR